MPRIAADIEATFEAHHNGTVLAQRQIVLLGSSPLPAAVAGLALKPREVRLVYPATVSEYARRVQELWGNNNLTVSKVVCLESAHDASKISDGIRELRSFCETSGLSYAGGTKAMAVHAYNTWKECGGRAEQASYLSADGWLHFDGGPDVRLLDEPRLSFDELRKLHWQGVPGFKDQHLVPADLAFARELREHVLASRFDTAFGEKVHERRWRRGDWLEIWLAGELADAKHDGRALFDEVHQAVTVPLPSQEKFEVDVLAVRGYRAYLFSCTLCEGKSDPCERCGARGDTKKTQAKKKLFEATRRASQLGGDHARAAVVCLYDNPESLLGEVHADWAGYDDARCFGEADINGGLVDKVCDWVLG